MVDVVEQVLPAREEIAKQKGGIQQLIINKRHKLFKVPNTKAYLIESGVLAAKAQ